MSQLYENCQSFNAVEVGRSLFTAQYDEVYSLLRQYNTV